MAHADAAAKEVYAKLGHRVRAARLAARLSQQNAAIQAGMDLRWWQRLESGEAGLTVRTLVRIAEALGISFWELVSAEQYDHEPPALRPARRRRR